MQEELFDVIDENGKVIAQKPRSEVHSKGLRHRAIYLIIFDERGHIFLQQRSANKDLMPLKWDFSVAGHLQPHESYEDAGVREAREELGIKVRNLKFIAEIPYYFKYPDGNMDDELNRLFSAEFEGKIKFKDKEVQRGKFIGLKQLLKEMEEKPGKFTPWLLNCRKLLETIE